MLIQEQACLRGLAQLCALEGKVARGILLQWYFILSTEAKILLARCEYPNCLGMLPKAT